MTIGKSTLFQIPGASPSASGSPAPDTTPSPLGSSDAVSMVNCYRPWQTCVVNELGDVRPSHVYWKSLGNLRTTSFASIWNNWQYQRLWASVNTRPDRICHSCRMPQFDSEENGAAMQLMPSLKQLVKGSAKSLFVRRNIAFDGVMDTEIDPKQDHASSSRR
jgi:hypothetical protein